MSTTTMEDFANALDVMFWGTLYPTLAVLPQVRARRSRRVVNITSIDGMVSAPHLLPYIYAKFAAVGLSEGLRAELGQEGIHVTTVVPGLKRTGSYGQARFTSTSGRRCSSAFAVQQWSIGIFVVEPAILMSHCKCPMGSLPARRPSRCSRAAVTPRLSLAGLLHSLITTKSGHRRFVHSTP